MLHTTARPGNFPRRSGFCWTPLFSFSNDSVDRFIHTHSSHRITTKPQAASPNPQPPTRMDVKRQPERSEEEQARQSRRSRATARRRSRGAAGPGAQAGQGGRRREPGCPHPGGGPHAQGAPRHGHGNAHARPAGQGLPRREAHPLKRGSKQTGRRRKEARAAGARGEGRK